MGPDHQQASLLYCGVKAIESIIIDSAIVPGVVFPGIRYPYIIQRSIPASRDRRLESQNLWTVAASIIVLTRTKVA